MIAIAVSQRFSLYRLQVEDHGIGLLNDKHDRDSKSWVVLFDREV
jgi:hypothetical protein